MLLGGQGTARGAEALFTTELPVLGSELKVLELTGYPFFHVRWELLFL